MTTIHSKAHKPSPPLTQTKEFDLLARASLQRATLLVHAIFPRIAALPCFQTFGRLVGRVFSALILLLRALV